MKLVIDEAIPYIKGALEPFADISYLPGRSITTSDIAGADALVVRTRTRCGESLLTGTRVRMIATATIGTDHIDLDYCRANNIAVYSAKGCNSRGVLQWVAASLAEDSDRLGWIPSSKTIGIVGAGNVGSLVEQYCRLWGFEVMVCDPPREAAEKNGQFYSLADLADCCDIITFHTPLTSGTEWPTYHLADSGFFDRIGCATLILNSSRGEVVDGKALLDATKQKNCRASIDTWESEPYIDRALLAAAQSATPHIAGYTAQGKANATMMCIESVRDFFGLPLGSVPRPAEVVATVPFQIGWNEMKRTIGRYFDIESETRRLRENAGNFEELRNKYTYRQEYF